MSLPDINELYAQFNQDYFNGELPFDLVVKWNSRLRTTAGRCFYKTVIRSGFGRIDVDYIDLNPRLLITEDKLTRTLIHEMVHAWLAHKTGRCHKHNSRFQSKMDAIMGYRRSHTYHDYDTTGLREERKIEYRCSTHGVIGYRARMPRQRDLHRYRCNMCNSVVSFVDKRERKTAKRKSGGVFLLKNSG